MFTFYYYTDLKLTTPDHVKYGNIIRVQFCTTIDHVP